MADTKDEMKDLLDSLCDATLGVSEFDEYLKNNEKLLKDNLNYTKEAKEFFEDAKEQISGIQNIYNQSYELLKEIKAIKKDFDDKYTQLLNTQNTRPQKDNKTILLNDNTTSSQSNNTDKDSKNDNPEWLNKRLGDSNFSYIIKKHIATLSSNSSMPLELNIISWNNGPDVFDIRNFYPDHKSSKKGITLKYENLMDLKKLLNKVELLSPTHYLSSGEIESETEIYTIHKKFGAIQLSHNSALELNLVSWHFDKTRPATGAKFDLRDWNQTFYRNQKYVRFNYHEILELKTVLNNMF